MCSIKKKNELTNFYIMFGGFILCFLSSKLLYFNICVIELFRRPLERLWLCHRARLPHRYRHGAAQREYSAAGCRQEPLVVAYRNSEKRGIFTLKRRLCSCIHHSKNIWKQNTSEKQNKLNYVLIYNDTFFVFNVKVRKSCLKWESPFLVRMMYKLSNVVY